MQHREDEVECERHEEELADLQPLQVEEALAERVLQEVVVARLYEGHEHRALAPALVGDQDLVVQLELAVHVVDVVLGEGDGLVQHVLELGQHAGDLAHDHGERRGAAVGAHRDVRPVAEQQVGAVGVLTIILLSHSVHLYLHGDMSTTKIYQSSRQFECKSKMFPH